MTGKQDGVTFYAICDASLDVGRSLTKGKMTRISGKILEVEWRGLFDKSFFVGGLCGKVLMKIFARKPIEGYWFLLDEVKVVGQ